MVNEALMKKTIPEGFPLPTSQIQIMLLPSDFMPEKEPKNEQQIFYTSTNKELLLRRMNS